MKKNLLITFEHLSNEFITSSDLGTETFDATTDGVNWLHQFILQNANKYDVNWTTDARNLYNFFMNYVII